jgi:hypothetical protein
MQGQKVRLIDYFVEAEHLLLVEIGPFNDLAHLGDHGP